MAITLRRRVESSRMAAPRRSAAVTSARVSRATLILGCFGVASAIFVLARLLESWRVTSTSTSHHISIFGLHLTYPAANAAAVVLVVLAALGLVVTARALGGAFRELASARRFDSRLAGLSPRPLRDALVIDDEQPRAFCAGLLRPRVYISTGALARLDERGLEAVLAHERHHVRRRDPLRLATTRVLEHALLRLPGLGELLERQLALAELSADEAAISAAPENRSGLAAAMLSVSDATAYGGSVGIDPARVDLLLGEPPNWRFPLALALGGTGVIALLLAVVVLAARVARGSATLAPPFLSAQPCVVVLALIPSVIGLLATLYVRRVRARS